MKKWIFGILTGMVTLVLWVILIDMVFKKTPSGFINATVSIIAGYVVYSYFKSNEVKSEDNS